MLDYFKCLIFKNYLHFMYAPCVYCYTASAYIYIYIYFINNKPSVLISFSAVGLRIYEKHFIVVNTYKSSSKTHQSTINRKSKEKHLTTKPGKDHKRKAHQAKQALLPLINYI